MKIIVFNIAAESGGALTILEKYYRDALQDNLNEWHFIISTPEINSKNNVKIHRYPWVKKSWFHRLFFDIFIANKIVKELSGNVVFSLQNIIIPFVKVKQVVYFHQILPFSEKRFGLKENPMFWIYQNIIGKLIIYSIKKADTVIVQANWIRNMFVNNYNISFEKIIVQSPELKFEIESFFSSAKWDNKTIYFYPASSAVYKNHYLIVKAAEKLMKSGIEDFEILFTLSGDEDSNIKELKSIIETKNLPIKFIGTLELSEVYKMYSKTILLFPSYLESYALPLVEAKAHNTPIITSDLRYAKETLDGYKNVSYINPFKIDELYLIMKDIDSKFL